MASLFKKQKAGMRGAFRLLEVFKKSGHCEPSSSRRGNREYWLLRYTVFAIATSEDLLAMTTRDKKQEAGMRGAFRL